MKINTSLALRNPLYVEETIDLSNADYSANYSLKRIADLYVETETNLVGNIFQVSVNLKAKLTLECAYTLEMFDQDLVIEDELYFTLDDQDEDSEDVFYERGPVIDLDPYIFGLILSHIPLRVTKPGATLPQGDGTSFEVIDEDTYHQNKHQANPFDDLDLDEFPD